MVVKLTEATDSSMDREEEELNDWEILEGLITSKIGWRLITFFRKITPDWIFRKWMAIAIASNYESAVSFIQDHEIALERLKDVRNRKSEFSLVRKEIYLLIYFIV